MFVEVYQGDVPAFLAAIWAEADINAMDSDGRTPLLHAVIDEARQLVELAIDSGADVNLSDHRGAAPSQYAAHSGNAAIVELLLGAGSLVECVDEDGNTTLSDAVFGGGVRDGIVKLLLDAGADLNKRNHHGVSPGGLARSMGIGRDDR